MKRARVDVLSCMRDKLKSSVSEGYKDLHSYFRENTSTLASEDEDLMQTICTTFLETTEPHTLNLACRVISMVVINRSVQKRIGRVDHLIQKIFEIIDYCVLCIDFTQSGNDVELLPVTSKNALSHDAEDFFEDLTPVYDEGHDLKSLASGALWALARLIALNADLQMKVATQKGFVDALRRFLTIPNSEEIQSSSLWILSTLASGCQKVKEMFSSDMLVFLLSLIQKQTVTTRTKGLVAWAIRAIVVDNKALQNKAALEHDAFGVLYVLLHSDVTPSVQAATMWTIASICNDNSVVRERITSDVIKSIVLLLDSPAPLVKMRAAMALHTICVRTVCNQSVAAEFDAIERLCGLIHSNFHSTHDMEIEKFLSALVCLLLNNPANQSRMPVTAMYDVVNLMTRSETRIQALCFSIVRIMVLKNENMRTLVGAFGGVSHCINTLKCFLTKSEDFPDPKFIIDQVMAALCNLLDDHAVNTRMARMLGADDAVAELLLFVNKKCTLTRTTFAFALGCLRSLGESDLSIYSKLKENEKLVACLTVMAHSSQQCQVLRQRSLRLMRAMYGPAELKARVAPAVDTLLQHLQVVGNEYARERGLSCCICVSEKAEHNLAFLPCLHAFHVECVKEWVQRGKDSCPVCKESVLVNIQKLLS